jgi:hypothetical protein
MCGTAVLKKEHRFFLEGEDSPACPCHKDSIKVKMSVKPWWNDTN